MFAFEAFDEHWKGDVGEEAGSGPHWGFWDADRVPKPAADVVAKWVQADVLPAPAHPCEYIALQAECRPKVWAPALWDHPSPLGFIQNPKQGDKKT